MHYPGRKMVQDLAIMDFNFQKLPPSRYLIDSIAMSVIYINIKTWACLVVSIHSASPIGITWKEFQTLKKKRAKLAQYYEIKKFIDRQTVEILFLSPHTNPTWIMFIIIHQCRAKQSGEVDLHHSAGVVRASMFP